MLTYIGIEQNSGRDYGKPNIEALLLTHRHAGEAGGQSRRSLGNEMPEPMWETQMSLPLFAEDILFLQRFLKCCHLYDGPLDGQFNTGVGNGEDALAARYQSIKLEMGSFDARSEACIMTLQPDAQSKARAFLKAATTLPLTYKIISGTRTYAAQDELFARGRTKPGHRVTNAKGGQSNHNFGIAWDVGIFDNGKYLTGATHQEEQAISTSARTFWPM